MTGPAPSFFQKVATARQRLEILDREYKRDKDGQFASGGDGGSRGIRQGLTDAGTTDEIGVVLGHELERITGHQLPGFINLDGLEPDLARAHAEGILRTAEMLPGVRIGEIRTFGPHAPDGPDMPADVVAKAEERGGGYGGIYLNTRWSAAEVRANMAQDDELGHAAGEKGDLTRIGSHEVGHVAHYPGGEATAAKVRDQIDAAAGAAGLSTHDYVTREVSQYANTNTNELMGEAVADVASRGDRASATSKTVVATLKESLDSGPTNRLNRTYKRDSRGRFGSGSGLGAHGPVRTQLRQAKTVDELNDALAGGIEAITGRRIPVQMAGSDLQVAREHGEGILRGLERFPDAPLAEVRVVGPPTGKQEWTPEQGRDTWDYLTLGGAMAATAEHDDGPRFGQRLLINRDYAGDPAKYDAALKESGKGRHLVAASPTGIALHEMGHVVARGGRSATAGRRAATAEAKRQGVKPSALIRRDVSHYAASSIHELSGEAFADVMVHGADASATSKLVFAQVASRAPGRGDVTALATVPAFQVLDRTYHRDSNGRFGSGGVRDSLTAAATTADVSAVLASEATAITGRTIRADMTGSDVQIAREHAEGILQGFEQYPQTQLEQIITYGPGSGRPEVVPANVDDAFAAAGDAPTDSTMTVYLNTVAFNNEYAADPQRYRDTLAAGERAGELIPGSPRGVALHEFGHHLADQTRTTAISRSVAAREVVTVGDELTAAIRRQVSDYALTDTGELAAEAFAEVMVRGPGASKISQAIVAEIDARYSAAYGPPSTPTNRLVTARFFEVLAERRDTANRIFKRDQNGQFASGGDGGARGIRDTLAQAGTLREVEKATKTELGNILGHGVAVSFKGLDPDVAKLHAEGVLRTAEMFPRTRLIGIGTAGPGGDRGFDAELAGMDNTHGVTLSGQRSGTSTIYFNTKHATVDAMRAQANREGASRNYRNTDDLAMTGSHEMAHAAHASLKPDTMTYAAARIMAHAKPAQVTRKEFVEAHLGRGAGGDYNELTAEAVAHVASRGTGAPPFAQEIVQQSQARWDGWEL